MEIIALQASSPFQVASATEASCTFPSKVFRDRSSLSCSRSWNRIPDDCHLSVSVSRRPQVPAIRCSFQDRHPDSGSPISIDFAASVQVFAEANEADQALVLKNKGSESLEGLKGTCIYLIGMMGSGKTTVGKLLAEALEYEFLDSDKLIEDAAGGMTVAQFFKEQDEEKFRNAETEVLVKLSSTGRSVVATGGGIVVRPLNWTYLRQGLTIWLNVPLDALAERVVAAGTHTRPLLGDSQGDAAVVKALEKLKAIYKFRAPSYAKADVAVCFQELVVRLGYEHVRDLSPMVIAFQMLEEINKFYKMKKNGAAAA
ncbi:hypothetical protein KP509_09G042000 [Ceratopteris richardii]|uniref:shikimate kinase n=1 Tax=Ceratopteris richardii TaxID=49495 RepID=A0A8T2U6D1_CERRI|nr:hypothetical protein KP509_09G042000 [Ceratopteris richardii]